MSTTAAICEREHDPILPRLRNRTHPLTPIPQERTGVDRAKERRRRAEAAGISPLRRPCSGQGHHTPLWRFATVREFFQPSFKLAEKHREGAHVSKRYHPPQTPCERPLQAESVPDAAKTKLREVAGAIDPLRLLEEIRAVQDKAALKTSNDERRPERKPRLSSGDMHRLVTLLMRQVVTKLREATRGTQLHIGAQRIVIIIGM